MSGIIAPGQNGHCPSASMTATAAMSALSRVVAGLCVLDFAGCEARFDDRGQLELLLSGRLAVDGAVAVVKAGDVVGGDLLRLAELER